MSVSNQKKVLWSKVGAYHQLRNAAEQAQQVFSYAVFKVFMFKVGRNCA
jgi:hypothetical protein